VLSSEPAINTAAPASKTLKYKIIVVEESLITSKEF